MNKNSESGIISEWDCIFFEIYCKLDLHGYMDKTLPKRPFCQQSDGREVVIGRDKTRKTTGPRNNKVGFW